MIRLLALGALCLGVSAGCAAGEGRPGGGDPLARVLAIVGLLLTIGNYGWDWWKFRDLKRERQADREAARQEREEQKKERVTVTLEKRMGGYEGLALVVQIYNPCGFMIPIESVKLCFQGGGMYPLPYESYVTRKMNRGDGKVVDVAKPEWAYAIDLESRRKVDFCLTLNDETESLIVSTTLQDLDADLWIAISSAGGEIHRIQGDEIISNLQELLAIAETMKSSREDKE